MNLTRREFGTALGAAAVAPNGPQCKVLDARGGPLGVEDLGRLYFCDLLLRPFSVKAQVTAGEARFDLPAEPFRIGVTLPVPGFGHVFVYADNRGRGYTRESFQEPLALNREFALDRIAACDRIVESGVAPPPRTRERIEKARALARKPGNASLYESLAESLYAGEELVLERARRAIEKRGARPGFLFGANAFGYPQHGAAYAERFEALFNYATLPFYLSSTEPELGRPDYGRVEKILSWLGGVEVLAKGHPLVWFFPQTTPEWLKGNSYAEVKRLATDYARRSVRRFRRRIHAWDVINEAHLQNVLGFTDEQQIDITRAASEAAREADPTCFRVINCCCTWSEYMRAPKLGQRTVYDYLKAARAAGIECEAIGLQYYYSGRDLLEIERSIETFREFGKPVHITELGLPSSSEEIENSFGQSTRFPWHGSEWSESTQADWVEQFYSIAYSKPYIEAVTWWDVTDPAFIPHGGLLHKDLTPKQSYTRLAALLKKWREMA